MSLGLLFVQARAEKIPALTQVSPKLPDSEQQIFRQRSMALEKAFQEFKSASDRFNAKAAKDQTDAEFDTLTAQRAQYIAAAQQFNSELAARVQALESRDTMVVDARNVPSGLPPAVDTAIASAFANAPPGVSDRVRKGFQAVMERDWKVASAWFEDALNHDPGNIAIKNLLAAVHPSSAPVVSPPSPASTVAPAQALQLPSDDDMKLLFDQRTRSEVIADEVFFEGLDPGWKKYVADERAAILKAAQADGDPERLRLLQDMYNAYDLEKSQFGRVVTPPPSALATRPQTPFLKLLLKALTGPERASGSSKPVAAPRG